MSYKSDPLPPQLTIKQVAESLRPGWDFKKDWLCWPPDTFALISVIMERTGCYRHCLIDYSWFRSPSYPTKIYKGGRHWLLKTAGLIGGTVKNPVPSHYFSIPLEEKNDDMLKHDSIYYEAVEKFNSITAVIEKYWDGIDPISKEVVLDLEVLRTINEKMGDKNPYSQLTEALIQLLGMADVACAGMGLLEKSTDNKAGEAQIVHCLANLLLTATGSLSTMPKFLGAVLPKMRTPQGGITPRSLSHHLTFHSSEVEVMWRTIPWSNHHQKSLNIIAVPFPFDITEDNFEPRSERFQTVQYFSYLATLKTEAAREKADKYIDKIVDLVWRESKKLDQIHILVFPESALTEEQYTYIKNKFYERLISSRSDKDSIGKIHYLPLIVAGIHKDGPEGKYEGTVDNTSHNEVRMATFFAGKWYDVAQRKHHRWHLNRNQLVQYWLAGKLPSERRWFEHISVAQRRLTILAPTGWLALTSLICEDLAQLDPVSAIIRGIGPTFLMALLSDGPQLNSRWSARYANVLADDPGTAVLSLTSLGMVKRSRKLTNDLYTDSNRAAEQPSENTVALWKDMLRGQQEISLSKGFEAFRMTISAKYKEEYTLDGRSDGVNASVFELEGYEQLSLGEGGSTDDKKLDKGNELDFLTPESFEKAGDTKSEKFEEIKKEESSSTINKESLAEEFGSDTEKSKVLPKLLPLEGTWLDIRELTALHFTLDSLIELKGEHCEDICSWIKAEPLNVSKYPRAIGRVLSQMGGALKDPKYYGIDATQQDDPVSWPTDDMKTVHEKLAEFFRNINEQEFNKKSEADYYEFLFKTAQDMIIENNNLFRKPGDPKDLRVEKIGRKFFLVPLAVMFLVHTKISEWQMGTISTRSEGETVRIVKLRKLIKACLAEHQYINFA